MSQFPAPPQLAPEVMPLKSAALKICTLVALQVAVAGAMQLPPDIQADRYLVRAERQIEQQDYAGAKESMDRILELQQEHGLDVPEEFAFRHAQISLRLDLYDEAAESATKYLTQAGRDGEHYRAALELLDAVDQAKAAAEAARRRPPGESRVFDGIEFVWVPAGEFLMGSTSAEAYDEEQPLTRVRISRGYWLGKYEVTQAEWQAVMGSNPSEFKNCGPNCPVEKVSWNDVQEFIRRLNGRTGEGRYRLPTEAEWEYAARAGTSGDRYGNLAAIAWYGDIREGRTQPAGRKAPNAWGLCDMLGNVFEWVQDWYGFGPYPGGFVTDPQGPGSGPFRGIRGGDWRNSASFSRAPYRGYMSPGGRRDYLGFRLLRME